MPRHPLRPAPSRSPALGRLGTLAHYPSAVYNTYTMRRTQIYLDEQQVAQLQAAAKTSDRSVSEIIRDAIDEKLSRAEEPDDFERAIVAAAGIWASRVDIGATDEYVRKLRRDRRGAAAS